MKSLLVSVPRVPHRERLLADPSHLGTRGKDGCRGPFELSLAANGTALSWTRHEQEGSGRAAAQAEGGDVGLLVRFGHNRPFAHEMKKQNSAARSAPYAALARLRGAVLRFAFEAVGRLRPLSLRMVGLAGRSFA